MTITGTIVVFVIMWWLSFFTVLPIGVRGQYEDGPIVPGTEEGAPASPMVRKKLLWATIGAFVMTGVVALILPFLPAVY